MPLRNKLLVLIISILSIIGLADSILLTREHFAHTTLNCTITKGCEKILSSSFATIFGIPVALLGVIFYFAVLLISLQFLFTKIYKKLLVIIASIGLISSFYLISIQAFVLKSWCQYCLLADLIAVLIFILSIIIFIREAKTNDKQEKSSN